jgi:hypothetical protein
MQDANSHDLKMNTTVSFHLFASVLSMTVKGSPRPNELISSSNRNVEIVSVDEEGIPQA